MQSPVYTRGGGGPVGVYSALVSPTVSGHGCNDNWSLTPLGHSEAIMSC